VAISKVCNFKIDSWFLFKKFRLKLAQASKIGFKVFSQSSGKQAVSFCVVRFFGLRFVWSSQALKIGYIFSAKVSASLGQAFSSGLFFFFQSNLFAKSVFSKGFSKSSALAFLQFKVGFVGKVGLVKNCGACKIKSVKAGFWFLGGESSKCRAH
jgi:hypothetical protein